MNTHIKHFLISTTIGLSIMLFFMVLNHLNGEIIDLNWIKNALVITASYSYPLYYVNGYSFDYIKKLASHYNLTIWKAVLMGFPFVMILNIIVIVMFQYLLKEFVFTDIQLSYGSNFWERIKVPLWISMTIGAIFYIFYFIKGHNKAKLEKKTTEATLLSQKHEALKTQIGPHFLFNSLNVVSGLIDENPEKAQNFVADLAQVYRYVLDQKDKNWVPLSEEIQFAQTYIDLVQTRFENGLIVHLEESLENSDKMIAPLTLQLLLENCIKHNAISASQPLIIHISQEGSHLIIQNNINPKKLLHHRKGTGLRHINSRYVALNDKINVTKTETTFTVEIPLFTTKTIKMKTQENYSEQELIEAREEVKERMGFFANLTAYVVICGIFVGINLYTGGYFWAIWPIMGWGIGLLFHGLGTFYFNNKSTSGYNWQERQARKILEKRKQSK